MPLTHHADDASSFTLTTDAGGGSYTATLAFAAPRDFDSPDDHNGDGVYELTLQVSDGTNPPRASHSISVILTRAVAFERVATIPLAADYWVAVPRYTIPTGTGTFVQLYAPDSRAGGYDQYRAGVSIRLDGKLAFSGTAAADDELYLFEVAIYAFAAAFERGEETLERIRLAGGTGEVDQNVREGLGDAESEGFELIAGEQCLGCGQADKALPRRV